MANQYKILIVEDDSFLLRMYSAKLEIEGFKIISATDGEKAVRLAKKEMPNLILLDLVLPKKDGFEILKELKDDPDTKDIPVIVLTNLGQKENIDKCYSLGAGDYLIKAHFIPSEVISKIKKVFENY